MFQVFAATPEDMGPGQIGAHAARAEAMGFDGLQVPDAIHDGPLTATGKDEQTVAAEWEKQRKLLGFLC